MTARSKLSARMSGAIAALVMLSVLPGLAGAATPASGTLGPADGASLAWDFAAVGPGALGPDLPVDAAGCLAPLCDAYTLTVSVPGGDAFYSTRDASMKITYTWTSAVPSDLDVIAVAPDGTTYGPGSPDDVSTGPGIEVLEIDNPAPGEWTIESRSGVTVTPTPSHGVAVLRFKTSTSGLPALTPTLPVGAPHFQNAAPPEDYQTFDILKRPNAGEPDVGVDWKTGAVMHMAGSQISRVTFDDSTKPANVTWTDVTPGQQSQIDEDEALYVDPVTGRTFAENFMLAGSIGTYSDDDGATWTQTTGNGYPHGPDHETITSGPYADPKPPTAGLTGYPHAVYYCSQDGVDQGGAFCSRSDTGGLTYNPSTPVFGATSPCEAIHGHAKVSPDGTVYVPNHVCKRADGKKGQGMAVSTDNGLTWTYAVVPDSIVHPNGFDPSIGIGADNTVYFGMEGGDGRPRIAVSHDHGATWSPSVDVGGAYGIKDTMFPAVIAGDGDRAAFSFLGTRTAGDDQSPGFRGVWYLYVSTTYDGGKTWTTVNATPGDPVQRGCIWSGGGSNACRNLLDFNDATVDKDGRVIVAFTDGCVDTSKSYQTLAGGAQGQSHGPSKCVSDPNSFKNTDKVAFYGLVRQDCGKGLFAKNDPGFIAGCPGAVRTPVKTKVLGTKHTRPSGAKLPATGVETPLLAFAELGGAILLRRRMKR